MVNDDAPRPHQWETPSLGSTTLTCEVCGGYKGLTAIGRDEHLRLVSQVENSEAGRAFAQHLAEARSFALEGGWPGLPPRTVVVEGDFGRDGELPDIRWEEALVITDLYRCPGRDPRVGRE